MFKTRDINPGSWRPHRNASTLRQLVEKRVVLLVVAIAASTKVGSTQRITSSASARIVRL